MQEFTNKHKRLAVGLCLAVILAVAFYERTHHFRALYPYFYYQDELRQAEMSLKVIREKTLRPDFYLYPHFPVYFNSIFYAAYFAKNNLRKVVSEKSIEPIVLAARNFDAGSPQSLYLQRGISLLLGLLCVFGVWLMARLFLSEIPALAACLIFALLPLVLSFSTLAKNDIYLECSLVFSFYFMFRLTMTGKSAHYIWAAIFAAIAFDSKVDYAPLVFLALATLVRAAREEQSFADWFRDRRTWLAGLSALSGLFIFSPYYFIHWTKGLEMAGWVYAVSALNSYNHIDYHHWWLDRYSYCLVVLLPFLTGIPAYLSALAGFLERLVRLELDIWFVLIANFGAFTYGYLSGSGGTFPLYTFMHLMPFFAILSVWPLQLLWQKGWKKISLGLGLLLTASALLQAQNYYATNFQAFDQIGPRLVKKIPPGAKILGYSVYLPGPALAKFNYLRAWPQNLDRKAVESFNPDYILVYRSDFAGFEKFFRDSHPANARLQELLSGNWGYKETERLEISYFNSRFFKWLDPEFVIELVLLEKIH